jgi:hypothetical protein
VRTSEADAAVEARIRIQIEPLQIRSRCATPCAKLDQHLACSRSCRILTFDIEPQCTIESVAVELIFYYWRMSIDYYWRTQFKLRFFLTPYAVRNNVKKLKRDANETQTPPISHHMISHRMIHMQPSYLIANTNLRSNPNEIVRQRAVVFVDKSRKRHRRPTINFQTSLTRDAVRWCTANSEDFDTIMHLLKGV